MKNRFVSFIFLLALSSCSGIPSKQTIEKISTLEKQRTYALDIDKVLENLEKKLPEFIASTSAQAFKSKVGCGSGPCPNNSKNIMISGYMPKDSNFVVCEKNPILGHSPALENGQIIIVAEPKGSNTSVSVLTRFGDVSTKIEPTGLSYDNGVLYTTYGKVSHQTYCYSTGIIEKSIFDLIQAGPLNDTTETLTFVEGFITSIPKEAYGISEIPVSAKKEEIEHWQQLVDDKKYSFRSQKIIMAARLGVVYAMGYGVPKNEATAAKWFNRSVDFGDASQESTHIAEYNLGVMYENGLGVAKNAAKALEWYKKSAAANNPYAKLKMGYLYADGLLGVNKDEQEALSLFSSTVGTPDNTQQIRSSAMKNIGFLANKGIPGKPKSPVNAYFAYAKAASEGDADAQVIADKLRQQLSPDQLLAVKKMLKDK